MLILIIAGGPDKGRIYELNDGEPIVLGREGDQVKLNDRKVSREHARLWSEGGQWYLEDLGSRHGTYRNHTKLETTQRAKLKDGDYLQIGNTVMVLGRMQVDSAQRLALIGGIDKAQPHKRSKVPAVAAGVAIAALLGMSGYFVYQLDELSKQTVSQEAFAQLQKDLVEANKLQTDRIAESIDKQTGVGKELLNKHQQLATTIDQTNQAIGKHGQAIANATDLITGQTDPILAKLETVSASAAKQQAALDRLGEMLAHQNASDNGPQLLTAMTQIRKMLADQAMGDVLVAKLDEAMKLNSKAAGEAIRVALAEHRKAMKSDAIASSDNTEALLNRVLTQLAQVPTQDQIAKEVKLAFADSGAKNEQFMRLVLAEIRKAGDQIATDVSAVAREDAGQAQTLMKQVVAELDKRPTNAQLASDLRKAMDEAFAKRDSDQGESQTQLTALMKKALNELEHMPTSEQLAADLRRMVGEDAQRTEALIARVLTELDQRPTAEQIAKQLQAEDNGSATKTANLLEQVLAKLDKQHQLTEQIASLREQIKTMPGRNTESVREVLTRLDQQDKNSAAMLSAISELRGVMPKDVSGQLDEVLAQLASQVRTDQITDTIEKSVQRIANAQDAQTQATLAKLTERLDALPSAEQFDKVAKSQDALAKLLDTSDAGDAIGELRASLEQLSTKIGAQPDDKLKQIIKMLEKRQKVELMLAELHDAMDTQSDQTAKLRKELLDAIAAADNPDTTRALRELMSTVQNRLATDDSVRQAIRDEMRGTLLPNQKAQADARDITNSANNRQGTPSQPANGTPRTRLTPLESAYKQSFETGEPVVVGAGVVDPQTGQVSKGRKIDPAIAKQLGFETWRDWYLTDRHAQQMRLQQEAIKQRNENDASSNPGTIKLPDADSNG